jgi:hypothetical protein
MDDLKQYLIAKLLWNTRADVKAIRADFLKGFYGKAAGPIDRYLDLLHDKVRKDNIHGFIFNSPQATEGLMTPEIVAAADKLFDEAQSLAENEAVLTRVKHARLSLEYFKIMQEANHAASGTPEQKAEALRKLTDFAARCKADGITQWSEGGTVDAIMARWSAALK